MINNKAKKDESRNLCHYQCIFISKLYTEWHFFIVPSSFRRLSINESEMTHIDIIPNLCRFVFGKINRSVHWIQYILSINTTSPMHFFFSIISFPLIMWTLVILSKENGWMDSFLFHYLYKSKDHWQNKQLTKIMRKRKYEDMIRIDVDIFHICRICVHGAIDKVNHYILFFCFVFCQDAQTSIVYLSTSNEHGDRRLAAHFSKISSPTFSLFFDL